MPNATGPQYRGAGWLEANGIVLSPLGRDVANVLGATYRGIYHIEDAALDKHGPEWANERMVKVSVGREIATVDGDELAQLVVRCADLGIRLAIRAKGRTSMELLFTRGRGMFFNPPADATEMVQRVHASGSAA